MNLTRQWISTGVLVAGRRPPPPTGTSANGRVSDSTWWNATYDTTTAVTSDVYPENVSGGGAGAPGTFTFTPKAKGVVSYAYAYAFNWADPVTVPAREDAPRHAPAPRHAVLLPACCSTRAVPWGSCGSGVIRGRMAA